MIIRLINNRKVKGRIWIDEKPHVVFQGDYIIHDRLNSKFTTQWKNKCVALELCMPRNNSNYALLGAEFVPQNGSYGLNIQIETTEKTSNKFIDTMAMGIENAYIGILPDYANAIKKSAHEYFEKINSIPSGILLFEIGVHGEIGSSCGLFSLMTKAVIKLLELTDYNTEEIWEVIRQVFQL